MDDEIDIEEHDILEHPQVKAAFPDLSKIQIEVHTSGGLFLDTSTHLDGRILEETKENTANEFEDETADLSKTAQETENEDPMEDNFANNEDILDDNLKETVEMHNYDSENDYDTTQDVSELVNGDIEVNSNLYTIGNKDDELQDVSEDKLIDEHLYDAADIDEDNEGMAVEEAAVSETIKLSNESVSETLPEPVENAQMIDDEMECQELAEMVENDDNVIEETTKRSEVDDLANDEFIDKAIKYADEFTEIDSYDPTSQEHSVDKNSDQCNEEAVISSEIASDVEDYNQVSIKEEIDYEPENLSDFDETLPEETYNHEDLPPEDIYHFNNKIILGSKPSPNGNLDNRKKNTYLVVLLEDWDVHLRNSHSYCADCRTLYTTPNALDAHRMTAHSLLAPIANRALKSTTKSSIIARTSITQVKNIAKKSTGVGNRDISDSTYCNHCNTTFKDHTTLIKHLYMMLPIKKYSCKICDSGFQTQNELVTHNAVHIKKEPRKILKAKTNSDNPILRNILNKDVKPIVSKVVKRCRSIEMAKPSKIMKMSPVEMKKEMVHKKWPGRFKCLICSDIFDNYGLARKHRFYHPESDSKMLFKKIAAKKVKPNTKVKVEIDKNEPQLELIPKSSLFQCSKCGLHLSSCIAGVSHVARGMCGARHWTCPTCKRVLRKMDEECHRKQHKLSHKFKVYNITRNMYERVLCKCLKCGVHFDNHSLKKHLIKCGKIPTAKCLKCNILIQKQKSAEHAKKHIALKLKPKDFIHIDYAVFDNTTANNKTDIDKEIDQKMNLEPDITIKTELNTNKMNKHEYKKEKVRLYYCQHCKCCMSRRNLNSSYKTHLNKKCVNRRYTSHCKICGLKLGQKSRVSHAKLHANKNLTLSDFVFYEFTTLKVIIPTTPVYPSCDKCKIHFLDSNLLKNHICGEDYENCEICEEKIENSALDTHLSFHRLHQAKKCDPKIMPELIMKYESLNAIWNILFICGKCELVTDLYNKAIEHSQGHINKELTQANTIKCYICNLKFEESCWSKHSELHSRMPINNNDFKILKYTPENLLDESWFQMFESLPETEIRQILDRSVFGSERSLKMKLIKDGLPEFTVYCCNICQVAYNNNDILNHVKTKCALPEYVCTICDIAFDTSATLHFHELLHKKGIKKEEFRIVNFDKSSAKKNKVKNRKAAEDTTKPVLKVNKRFKNDEKYTLYRCVECSVCVLKEYSQILHNCAPAHHQVYCKLCKLNFPFRQMAVHNGKHKSQPDFRAKNIKVVDFEPTTAGKDKSTSRKVKRNLKSSDSSDSSSDVELSKTKPKQRRTLNSSKHKSIDKSIKKSIDKSDTEDKKTAKIYKCDCGLHYTSLRTIEKHIENCNNDDDDISKENCSKCGLLFPTDVLVSHLCKHHSQDINLTVELVHKTQNKSKIKLYKCSECNVYFLNQNTCYKHAYKHERMDPKQYIECKICCLQFKILSLHVHIRKHHNTEFDLDKVVIEEYKPTKGTPKIEVYFASEKIQNVQVSSSND